MARESASSRDEVHKSGGMEAIIATMRTHEHNASLVCEGCNALGELATVSPSMLNALSDAHVGASTLSLLGSQVGLASSFASGALTWTTAGKSASGADAKEKAVESIRASGDTFFAAVGGMVQSSSEAFKNIFSTGTLRRHKLVGLEAPQPGLLALVRALEVFADLPEVVLAAFGALGRCAEGKELACKAMVARAGMAAVVVAWGTLGCARAESVEEGVAGRVVVAGVRLLTCLLEGPCAEAEAAFLAVGGSGGGSGGAYSGGAAEGAGAAAAATGTAAAAAAAPSGFSSVATINALLARWAQPLQPSPAAAAAAATRDEVLSALCSFLGAQAFAGGALRKALFAADVHATLTGAVGAVASLSAPCAAAAADAASLIAAEGRGLLGASLTKASSSAASLMGSLSARMGGSSGGGSSSGGSGGGGVLPSLASLPKMGSLWK